MTMWWLHKILCLVLLQLSSSTFSSVYRLPVDLQPEHYRVTIIYDIDETISFSYFGLVEIEIKVLKPTRRIVLHAEGFIINNYDVRLKTFQRTQISNLTITRLRQLLYIQLDELMEPNSVYFLSVPYFGRLKSSDLRGVVANSYFNSETKQTEYVVSTNFKPVYARRAFPCYDEPSFKANFSLSIGHNSDYKAASNMPLLTTSTENLLEEYWPWRLISDTFRNTAFQWHQFETSKMMSTYQVAFALFKFSRKSSPFYKYIVNVWARNDRIDQASYAVTITIKLLNFMEDWFTVPHTIPKLDIVVVPDSSFDCLESWGLIICSEELILYDLDQSSVSHKRETLKVMAQVLARHWFGNLVTVVWWNDAWLFEGFSNYIASLSSENLEPTWFCTDVDTVNNMLEALRDTGEQHLLMSPDTTGNSQHMKEIHLNNMIITSKAFMLLRMTFLIFDDKLVKKAVNNFLEKYSFRNANQNDLWSELMNVGLEISDSYRVSMTMKTIMTSWITQPGYPLLTVQRELFNETFNVTQKRYLPRAANENISEDISNSSWYVPLAIVTRRRPCKQHLWLSTTVGVTSEQSFTYDAEFGEWLLLNKDLVCLYRVNYDDNNWKLLNTTLHSSQYEEIPTMNRVQLLSDAFALIWSNEIDFNIALEMFNYLKKEINALPLMAGIKILQRFDTLLNRRPDYGVFQKYVGSVMKPAYKRAGGLHAKKILFKNDMSSVEKQVMTTHFACYMNVQGCEQNALDLFQEWMKAPQTIIPHEFRQTVFCVAAARGSVAEWRFLFNHHKGTDDVSLKRDLLQGMACSRDIWILKMFLQWALEDGSVVHRKDSGMVISSIMRSQVGYYVAKEFVYERIKDIHDAFLGHLEVISSIIKVMLEQFTTDSELNEFVEWKETNFFYLVTSEWLIEQAIKDVRHRIAWLKMNEKKLITQMELVTRPELMPLNDPIVLLKKIRDTYSFRKHRSCAKSIARAWKRIIIITLLVIRILFVELICL